MCDSRRCREEEGEDANEKTEEQKSSYLTYDDDDDDSRSVAAAAAYDAIDVSRPVSQTSLLLSRRPAADDDAREIPANNNRFTSHC